MTKRRRLGALGLAVGALVLAGCPGPTSVELGPDAPILFLTQLEAQSTVLQALYQGRVNLDQQGCLRLEGTADRHTVIWPHGFGLARDKVSVIVQDPDGREKVRVGENTRFGGGEVVDLPTGLLSAGMAAAARERCPGRYWIVGEFPG
ncbi:MAG: hypothetical protein OEO23_06480 [Gemmatimonadota bacterium]|nr:hypothetical protein [Gemmatimonadota bacterium]